MPIELQVNGTRSTSTRRRHCFGCCERAARTRRPRARHSWAELMRRVFEIDVLTCPHCDRGLGSRRAPRG